MGIVRRVIQVEIHGSSSNRLESKDPDLDKFGKANPSQIFEEHRPQGQEDQALERRFEGKKALQETGLSERTKVS